MYVWIELAIFSKLKRSDKDIVEEFNGEWREYFNKDICISLPIVLCIEMI